MCHDSHPFSVSMLTVPSARSWTSCKSFEMSTKQATALGRNMSYLLPPRIDDSQVLVIVIILLVQVI